jgi:very-short-patch-repair endonuclease
VRDARLIRTAGAQFNRLSRDQLTELGYTRDAIEHRLATGRLVIVEQGVLAIPPVLDDDWGRWMGATLTAPGTFLSHVSAAAARGFWTRRRHFETVTRAGNGGPRRHGGVLALRSSTLEGETETYRGIPTTTVPRTVLDLAATRSISDQALARAVREAIRLELTSLAALADYLARRRGRRGTTRLAAALARYSGLPIHRARSGAEVRAMEHLRDAHFELPALNVRRAGDEADLSWRSLRVIIEIDGGPFHLDRGEDARKQAIWEGAGWTVRRIPSDDVYEVPERLIALAAALNVPRYAL